MMTEMVIAPIAVSTAQGSFSSGVTTPDADTVTSYWQLGMHSLPWGCLTCKDVN